MHETAIIIKREFKSYFLSPIAYVIGVLFLLIVGWLFFRMLFVEGGYIEARMAQFFMLLPITFLVLCPALTMRLWSEERKLGTLELLMTFPAKIWHLILGKFLAALLFLTVLLVLTLPYAFTLGTYAELDWGPVIGGYLGAVLLAAACLGVGLFFSSITRDQIVAFILTVVVLTLFYLMGQPDLLTFLPDWLSRPLVTMSLANAFNSIARGVLDSRDVLYYVGFAGLFLYLNSVILQTKKWRG
jgi:ABC-2 type transport system permease protein